jgi:hypothetical protein
MPRTRKSGDQLVVVHPVAGRFVPGVPHVSQRVTADEAEALVLSGAFAAAPIHEPACNAQCDAAAGEHYLTGDDADSPAPAPGDDSPPPTEAATQPDGPADEAESAHGSAEEPVAPAI